MLPTRFTGLVLGLFFVLHAFNSCSVHANQGGEIIGEKHVASEESSFVVSFKGFIDGFRGRKMGGHHEAVVVRKETGDQKQSGFGVMASKNSGANRSDGPKCHDFEEKGSAFNVKCKIWHETTSIATPPKVVETADFVAFGADYHGPTRVNGAEIMPLGKFQDQANNQAIGMNKLETKTRDYQPFHLLNPMQLEESKAVPSKPVAQEPLVIGNRVESKRLLEAVKEIENLMNKDYKWDRPRRKPPINNHMPRH
ncbi:hypothetical protein PTKIN_Ptkin12aG0028600 [Pterospermum kingtungense]